MVYSGWSSAVECVIFLPAIDIFLPTVCIMQYLPAVLVLEILHVVKDLTCIINRV